MLSVPSPSHSPSTEHCADARRTPESYSLLGLPGRQCQDHDCRQRVPQQRVRPGAAVSLMHHAAPAWILPCVTHTVTPGMLSSQNQASAPNSLVLVCRRHCRRSTSHAAPSTSATAPPSTLTCAATWRCCRRRSSGACTHRLVGVPAALQDGPRQLPWQPVRLHQLTLHRQAFPAKACRGCCFFLSLLPITIAPICCYLSRLNTELDNLRKGATEAVVQEAKKLRQQLARWVPPSKIQGCNKKV